MCLMANEIVLREIMRQVECWPLYALAPVKATRENKRFFRFFILSTSNVIQATVYIHSG